MSIRLLAAGLVACVAVAAFASAASPHTTAPLGGDPTGQPQPDEDMAPTVIVLERDLDQTQAATLSARFPPGFTRGELAIYLVALDGQAACAVTKARVVATSPSGRTWSLELEPGLTVSAGPCRLRAEVGPAPEPGRWTLSVAGQGLATAGLRLVGSS